MPPPQPPHFKEKRGRGGGGDTGMGQGQGPGLAIKPPPAARGLPAAALVGKIATARRQGI